MATPNYVPILKLKAGEKQALCDLADADARRITPLFEIVERKATVEGSAPKTIGAHLKTAFKGLAPAVSRSRRYFLDTWEIRDDGVAAACAAFGEAAKIKTPFVPVTGLSRTHDVQAATDAGKRSGVAIRVTREEFESGVLKRKLVPFCQSRQLRPSKVDLVLDLGSVEDMLPEGVGTLGEAFLRDVPNPEIWRTVTMHSTAFPLSMGKVKSHSSAFVERSDFCGWHDHIYARRHEIPRLPDYSDTTIQHPRGVEDFNPKIHQGSAAIRYAVGLEWLLVKGAGTKSTRPTLQFPGLARRLTTSEHPGKYMGLDHCAGCNLIHAAASGAARLGSLTQWRTIGTVHHIAVTLAQLSALA